jgi:hypothetical protein
LPSTVAVTAVIQGSASLRFNVFDEQAAIADLFANAASAIVLGV